MTRYQVVEGFQDGLSWAVADTERPKIADDTFDTICECWTREDADKICAALNAQEAS